MAGDTRFERLAAYLLTSWRPVAIVALGIALLIFAGLASGAWTSVWKLAAVPPMSELPLSFGDLRLITHKAFCEEDPYLTRACDPWGRVLNYPPIWLNAAQLMGIGPDRTNIAGIAFAILLLSAFALAFRPTRPVEGIVTVLAIASPPVMVAIERGNSDSLIYAGLVFGLALSARLPLLPKRASMVATIAVLTVLKVFPIAAAAIFVRAGRGWMTAIVAASLAAIALVVTTDGRLNNVLANTPLEYYGSFGGLVLPKYAFQLMEVQPPWRPEGARWVGLAIAVSIAAVVLVAYLSMERVRRLVPVFREEDWRTDLALAGLCLYAFAFMLGSYDYRLISLVLALPGLMRENSIRRTRSLTGIIGVIVFFLWASRTWKFAVEELLDLSIFACVVAILLHRTLGGRSPEAIINRGG